ncbi:MAG: glycosyltransferase family 39 protein [Chloroflexi bacterium]|uniref:glycosyltransferase family 39 protein n=1 Tax=Candidatus Flexifilum breve TaxID=3140694 RepID=UPI003134DBD6|nr:glycosyltransferase family 39 protein [Chloroflexota bacterium]
MPRRSHTLIVIIVLMLVALVARIIPGPRTIDDAFITFRYSRNIVEGIGFVYNPGVHTLGTTTPLFTLIMAAFGVVGGGAYPWYALTVSALADAISTALIFLIARKVTGRELVAIFPAALWAISPMSVTFAVGGMETSVVVLWLIVATYFYVVSEHKWRDIAMGLCAGLGVLTRVDSVLWIGPLLVWQLGESWITRRKLPLRTWSAAVLVVLPWMLFSLAYFGTAIPNSVTAKRFAYLIQPNAALGQLLQTYSNAFFQFDLLGSLGVMIGAVLILACTLFAFSYALRSERRMVPLLLYPWVYFAAFAVLNPQMFRWYNAPPLPALIVGVFVGLWALLRPLQKQRFALPLIAGGIGVLCVVTSLSGWTLTPDHGPNRPAPKMAWHAIELLYQQMGEHLRNDLGVTAETRVASGDIGAVGYFSRATIVDTVGLVTPELTRYYPINAALIVPGMNYAIPPQLIYDTQPDYLVTMEGFVRQGLAQQEAFNAEYALITEYPFDFYGAGMQLYQRQGD